MKKSKKILSVVLCLTIILGSMGGVVSYAAQTDAATTAKNVAVSLVDNVLAALCRTVDKSLSYGLNKALNKVKLTDVGIEDKDTYVNELAEKYSGHESFADEAADGAVFSLGYDKRDIMPDDFYEGNYYKYGAAEISVSLTKGTKVDKTPADLADYYADKYAEENGLSEKERDKIAADLAKRYSPDVLSVRTICLDDSRGKVLIASVDCIGLTNASKNAILKLIDEYCEKNGIDDIVSVNVCGTHTHSSIDTLGIMQCVGQLVDGTIISNMLKGVDTPMPDEKYMSFLYETVADSMIAAYNDMHKGELYFSKDDSIIEYTDENGEKKSENFFQPGADTTNILPDIYKLTFVPYENNVAQTVIANFAVHPEKVGVSTAEEILPVVSADFIPYMEQQIQKNCAAEGIDCNFIFINSAIGSMIKMNFGKMNEIYKLEYEDGKNPVYNTTYENRSMHYGIVIGDYISAMERGEKVDPILNTKTEEVIVKCDNPIIRLLAIVQITNNTILTDKDNSVYTVSEVGYMEIGSNIKIFMCPGEINPELIATDDHLLSGDYSITRKDFQYKSLINYFDENDNVLVFGLMNDMAGYIDPDNDYALAVARLNSYGDKEGEYSLKANTNAILFSYSSDIASTLIGSFLGIVDGVNGNEVKPIIRGDFNGIFPYANYIISFVNYFLKALGIK